MEPKESALFIGGSRGIGRVLAIEAARRGIQPIVVARQFRPDDHEIDSAVKIAVDVATFEGMHYLRHEPSVWQTPYVFWVAGSYMRSRLSETEDRNIDRMLLMHQGLMMKFVRDFQRTRSGWWKHIPEGLRIPRAFTLVVMGSISSYKIRKHEAVYAGAKAGQAAFLRTFAAELAEDIPGSRVVLVNAARIGGESGEQKSDAGGMRIDPGFIAKLVWGLIDPKITKAGRPYLEVNIERDAAGPNVTYGPQTPETI